MLWKVTQRILYQSDANSLKKNEKVGNNQEFSHHFTEAALMYIYMRGDGTLGTTSRGSFRRNTRCIHWRDPANLPDQWQHFKCLPPHPSWWQNNSNVSRKDSLWAPHFGHCQKILYFEQHYRPSKNLVECSLRTIPSGSNMCFYKKVGYLNILKSMWQIRAGSCLVPEDWMSPRDLDKSWCEKRNSHQKVCI